MNLDELFQIVGPIIFIDVPALKLVWPNDLPEWWS
jgi:hypothetical protein